MFGWYLTLYHFGSCFSIPSVTYLLYHNKNGENFLRAAWEQKRQRVLPAINGREEKVNGEERRVNNGGVPFGHISKNDRRRRYRDYSLFIIRYSPFTKKPGAVKPKKPRSAACSSDCWESFANRLRRESPAGAPRRSRVQRRAEKTVGRSPLTASGGNRRRGLPAKV